METKYYLKDPILIENDNDYAKYFPVGVCGYLKYEYGKCFNNNHWPELTDIPVSEGNTEPVKGKYDNGDPTHTDGHK